MVFPIDDANSDGKVWDREHRNGNTIIGNTNAEINSLSHKFKQNGKCILLSIFTSIGEDQGRNKMDELKKTLSNRGWMDGC